MSKVLTDGQAAWLVRRSRLYQQRKEAGGRRLTPAQRALAGDPASIDLAERIAGRHAKAWPECRDEFRQAAYLGLCLAASRYDPEKDGAPFRVYAGKWIHGRIRDYKVGLLPLGFRWHKERPPGVRIPKTFTFSNAPFQITLMATQ